MPHYPGSRGGSPLNRRRLHQHTPCKSPGGLLLPSDPPLPLLPEHWGDIRKTGAHPDSRPRCFLYLPGKAQQPGRRGADMPGRHRNDHCGYLALCQGHRPGVDPFRASCRSCFRRIVGRDRRLFQNTVQGQRNHNHTAFKLHSGPVLKLLCLLSPAGFQGKHPPVRKGGIHPSQAV